MIKLLEYADINELLEFCLDSILGTRIACYALSYGFEKSFVTLWGEYVDGRIATAIALFDDSITVLHSDKTDFSLLNEFLDVICWSTVSAEESCIKMLSVGECETKQGYRFVGNAEMNMLCIEPDEDDMHNIYKLICKSIPDSFSEEKEAYLAFLSDFTFRRTRGYSRALCIRNEGRLACCAVTSAESDCFAVISGVACDPECRKSGLGKATVLEMVCRLSDIGKSAFVIALNENARGFYEHIGFAKDKKISTARRKV